MIQTKYIIYSAVSLLLIGLFSSLNLMELRAMEPIRALVAMELMINHDQVHPTLTGAPYLHKPPFFNWILEVSFWITGSFKEWAVRVPSILAYLLTGVAMFLVLKGRIGKKVSVLAIIFFWFGADLLFYGTVNGGEMDLFLPLPVFAQVAILPILYKERKWLLMFILSYGILSLVFLTKHFAAIAIHFLAILALVISEKDWRLLFRWQHFIGIFTFLGIVSLYFYAYSTRNDLEPFLANLFLETTDKTHSGNIVDRLLHLIEVPVSLLKLLFPWSLLVFFLWRKNIWGVFNQNNLLRYSLIFSLLNIGVYWLIGQPHDRYLYPLFPFFSIVLAGIFENFTNLKFRLVAWLAFVLAAGRIVYNLAVMPLQQERLHDRSSAFDVVKIANGEPVYLTGWEVVRKFDKELFGLKILNTELRYPGPIPYGIPYILTRETGRIVQFHPEPVVGKLYLAPAPFVEKMNKDVLYTISVGYIDGGILLCRLK